MYQEINASELKELKGIIVIDVRERYEYQEGHVPGSIHIPLTALISNPEDYLVKNKKYYIMCQTGVRSRQACDILSRLGYQVVQVLGGYSGYMKK